MNDLVAMETLLPWQQANCAITALCEYLKSILGTYVPWVSLVYLVAMVTTVTMQQRNCAITQQHESISSLYVAQIFFVT